MEEYGKRPIVWILVAIASGLGIVLLIIGYLWSSPSSSESARERTYPPASDRPSFARVINEGDSESLAMNAPDSPLAQAESKGARREVKGQISEKSNTPSVHQETDTGGAAAADASAHSVESVADEGDVEVPTPPVEAIRPTSSEPDKEADDDGPLEDSRATVPRTLKWAGGTSGLDARRISSWPSYAPNLAGMATMEAAEPSRVQGRSVENDQGDVVQRPSPRWGAKIRTSGCGACTPLPAVERKKSYTLEIELSTKLNPVLGGKATEELEREIYNAEAGTVKVLKLVPLFLEGILPAPGGLSEPIEFKVNQAADDGVMGSQLLNVAIPQSAKKCSSIIISVWNEELSVALDGILITLGIYDSGGRVLCPDPVTRGRYLNGVSLLTLTDVFASQGGGAERADGVGRVSIYAFELPTLKSSYMFASLDSGRGHSSVHGWKLDSPLSKSFGDQSGIFNKAALDDRGRMSQGSSTSWVYEKTAKFIKRKLFTAADSVSGADPEQVFRDIQAIVNRSDGKAIVTSQVFVPIEGNARSSLMFLPFRLMSAPNSEYFRDFVFSSPIPSSESPYKLSGEFDAREDPVCVSHWTVIMDRELGGSAAHLNGNSSQLQSSIDRLASLPEKPWRSQTLVDVKDVRAYFEKDDHFAESEGASGLILAAHYGGDSIRMQEDLIASDELRSIHRPGSVAVLAACETGSPREATGIIYSMRKNNFDSFFASPLKVPSDYAIRFVDSLVSEIDAAYEQNLDMTVADLYVAAAMRVRSAGGGGGIDDQNLDREYVVIGDAGRRICRKTN